MGCPFPSSREGRWSDCSGADRQLSSEGAPLRGGRKRGEKNQAIGRSRGGRTTKIHALTDAKCRPLAFMLTGGQVADCTAGADLIKQLPDCDILHADKGYDANAIRRRERDMSLTYRRLAKREVTASRSPLSYTDRPSSCVSRGNVRMSCTVVRLVCLR